MTEFTQIQDDIVIEDLKCSFVKCKSPLVPQGNNNKFMYYFYKLNQPIFNTSGNIIQGEPDPKATEIKFICCNCINVLKKEGQQFIKNIEQKIDIQKELYSVYTNKEERESTSPPKQGIITLEKQYCKKCIDNQIITKAFDENIQKRGHTNINQTVEIAKYYAEEQYHKDKETLNQLKIRLSRLNNEFSNRMEKLLILNKIRMIMKKYDRIA
ncbi:unnamed protein product [Paramecium sonneborni]|uniref:Uncharacterized protein n=1 Tax=Paramecium sonneborni TaxID=65129 RepID=A0A8S1R3N8_9CILI|nr:unnamed protein product [Paramecium sonneborni]